MIGMVNAIGAGQAARELHGAGTTGRPTTSELGEPPMWVRPAEPPASPTESARAVRPVEFQESQGQQSLPDGDRLQGAVSGESERPADAVVGSVLDTTA
jgi:hypothetical protein